MMRACREQQSLAGICSSAPVDPRRQGNIDPTDCIDDLFKCPHIDGGVMVELSSEVECQGPCQQTGSLRRIVGISKARIPVKVSLVEFFVVLPIDVICNIGNLHPQV